VTPGSVGNQKLASKLLNEKNPMANEPVKPPGGELPGQDLIQHHIVPASGNRWVLLHYHVFKNAGSTIEHVLQRSFGTRFATLHGPEPDSVLNGGDIAAYLRDNPTVSAISSHHIRYPKPIIPEVIVFDICFFRDPMQRLWSMYKFMRRSAPAGELGKLANSADARSFFDHLLQEYPHLVNDVQVTTLASRGEYTRPPTETDLRSAREALNGISVLGVVDVFDESAIAAEYFLRPTFPMLRFHSAKQNADPESHASVEMEKENFRIQAGDSIYRQLERMNELDTELVASARTEVMRRWSLLPNKDARVADFRERCQGLRKQAEAADVLASDENQ
jgi:hypothetical protein